MKNEMKQDSLNGSLVHAVITGWSTWSVWSKHVLIILQNNKQPFLFISAFSAETRNFKNERCMPRETLVHVDQINGVYFFPLVVKLHRCGGSCLNVPPNKRKCIAKTVEKIPISVKKLANFRERSIIHMENETSCDCPCTINESSCNLERQIFDDQACKYVSHRINDLLIFQFDKDTQE